jgi:hypothetical protein
LADDLSFPFSGNENYDWYALQENAEYKNGYSFDHPTIRLFWEVFHEMSLEQKKNFLLFLTGSDRIPILGMKAVRVCVLFVIFTDLFWQLISFSFSGNHPEDCWWRLLFACSPYVFQSLGSSVVQHQGKASLQVASSHPTDSRFRPSLINFDVTILVTLKIARILF